jgi:hypothetical protein
MLEFSFENSIYKKKFSNLIEIDIKENCLKIFLKDSSEY